MDTPQAIILDNGSGTIKAGFAGDGEPRLVLPTALGVLKEGKHCQARPQGHGGGVGFVLGTEVEADDLMAAGLHTLSRPIEHGAVKDWEDVEHLWRHAFTQLGAADGGFPVLVTEPPLSATTHREQMVTLLFEEFNVASVHIALSGAMSLYATGSRTGLVVEVGDGVGQVVPIFEGFVLPHAVQRLDLGGRDLTEYFVRLLYKERGCAFQSGASRWAAKSMKEQLCYVTQHYKSDWATAHDHPDLERTFALPDGSALILAGSERFRCPEALFQPSLLGMEASGIHDLAFQAITKCDMDVQKGLASNIVLSGGTMMFQGMRERMLKELTSLAPPSLLMKVTMPPSPRDAAFVGGSILASVEDVQRCWLTKKEYDEHGVSIIHSRCLNLTDTAARRPG